MMDMNFNYKNIDFEFPIERMEIDYPSIIIVFDNVQDLHHFESILKEHNGKDHKFEFDEDDEYTIQAPLEFLDKMDVNIA